MLAVEPSDGREVGSEVSSELLFEERDFEPLLLLLLLFEDRIEEIEGEHRRFTSCFVNSPYLFRASTLKDLMTFAERFRSTHVNFSVAHNFSKGFRLRIAPEAPAVWTV